MPYVIQYRLYNLPANINNTFLIYKQKANLYNINCFIIRFKFL